MNQFFSDGDPDLDRRVGDRTRHAVPARLAGRDARTAQRRDQPRAGRNHAALRLRQLLRRAPDAATCCLPCSSGMAVGLLMGVATAFISVTLKAEQGISGIGVYLFGLGLSDLLFVKLVGTPLPIASLDPLRIPLLSDIPLLGPMFFEQTVLVYVAFLLVPVVAFVLNRTTYGTQIKAVGENPSAADSLGVSVARIRWSTVLIGCTMAGLAGASLLLYDGIFQQNLTQSQGFIAVALVYFGAWTAWGVMGGSLLYGLVGATVLAWKSLGIIPLSASDLAATAPAVLTVLALLSVGRRFRAPPSSAGPTRRRVTHRRPRRARSIPLTGPGITETERGTMHTRTDDACRCWSQPARSCSSPRDAARQPRRRPLLQAPRPPPRWRPWPPRRPRPWPRAPRPRRHRPRHVRRGRPRPQGRPRRAERQERPGVHPVDGGGAPGPPAVGEPADRHLRQPVRRRRCGQRDPAVRVRGLQPRHRPRVAVRLDDPAARPAVPERLVRVGDRRLDLQPAERVRVPGQFQRGRVRAGRTWPPCSASPTCSA